jgi:integrase
MKVGAAEGIRTPDPRITNALATLVLANKHAICCRRCRVFVAQSARARRAMEYNQMSIRKRTWRNGDGSQGEAWVVAYTGADRKRHIRSFAKKRDADSFQAEVEHDLRAGRHVPDSQSLTVAEAGRLWLETCGGLERTTLDSYRQHLDQHITPLIGTLKLSRLTVAAVRGFIDDVAAKGRSPGTVRKARFVLGAIVADAQERGLVGHNAVRELRAQQRGDRRRNGKLKVGVDIPTPDEIKALIGVLTGPSRPLLLTAILTGLRASELRGLRWADIDLKRGELHVRQRADCYNAIGRPKSAAGERTVPLPPLLISELKTWKLACPNGTLGLAFPNGAGKIESHANIVQRMLQPAMIAAGLTNQIERDGEAVTVAKYSGLHCLRHFFVSWCINRKADGGLELPPKTVQERIGHSSITITFDRYGHLFPRGDDGAELAAAEQALIG